MYSNDKQGVSKRKSVVSPSERQFEQLIDATYRIGQKIGSGSYGQIYSGTNVHTNTTVAIKMERDNSEAQLRDEYRIYRMLQENSGQTKLKGFPEVYYFGQYLHYQVLVLERLGRNLESVFDYCGRNFSIKSMIFLTLQLLKRFQTIHGCGILYW